MDELYKQNITEQLDLLHLSSDSVTYWPNHTQNSSKPSA